MRALIFFALLFASTITHAQFSLSINGGGNSTTGHVAQPGYGNGTCTAKLGWLAGLGVEYGFKHTGWLLYSGLTDGQNNLNHKSTYDTTKYKPVFLTLPLGTAYNWAVVKKVGLRFYAGMYGALGLGGKYISKDVFLTPGGIVYGAANRKISFGNNNTNDITHFNWGTQFGAGLKAWQFCELVCMYNLGLNNILPNGRGEKVQLRSLSLDFKVDIITSKQSKT